MTQIRGEIQIDAPRVVVWETLADLGAVQDYNPSVTSSYYTSEKREGPGASRHCDLKPFGSVEERVVEWEDGRSMKIEIYEGQRTPPFRKAHAVLSVDAHGDQSLVRMALSYELKYGPIGKLIDRFVVRQQFQKVVPITLSGLKRHVETLGAPAGRA